MSKHWRVTHWRKLTAAAVIIIHQLVNCFGTVEQWHHQNSTPGGYAAPFPFFHLPCLLISLHFSLFVLSSSLPLLIPSLFLLIPSWIQESSYGSISALKEIRVNNISVSNTWTGGCIVRRDILIYWFSINFCCFSLTWRNRGFQQENN